MNIDRFRHLWKIFSFINKSKDFHIFKYGASVDTMVGYVNKHATHWGGYPVSKQEIRDVLKMAKDKGYIKEIYRYYEGNDKIEFNVNCDKVPAYKKIPSSWKFMKG